MSAELGQHRSGMAIDGPCRKHQSLGDLGVCQALAEQPQHLQLPVCCMPEARKRSHVHYVELDASHGGTRSTHTGLVGVTQFVTHQASGA